MATKIDPETGAWHCAPCNVFNEKDRTTCFECGKARAAVDGSAAASSTGTPQTP